ncbi:MAG TPA: hypothetical protein VG187_04590 [Mycobacterium sp.]|nr:hypothetical protein [Mycobacterium sp.]
MTKRRAPAGAGKSASRVEARHVGVAAMTELTLAEVAKELDALNQS